MNDMRNANAARRLAGLLLLRGLSLGLSLALILALILLAPGLAPAAGVQWDIDRLMQSLARISMGRADYVETRYIAMLDRPVQSSGQLFYVAPDKLEKRTLRPKPESMIIEGNTVTIERGQQNLTMQVDSAPELAGFVNSIRGTMAGDRQALERSFTLALEGPADRWVLTLTPREARLAAAIRSMRISGSGDDVRSVEILQADGDRSVMTIKRVSAQ
jgi:outer membrane lipoprotein-sorting protein